MRVKAHDDRRRTTLKSAADLPKSWMAREAVIVGGYDQSHVLAAWGHGFGITPTCRPYRLSSDHLAIDHAALFPSLAGWLR
jgi:hypothetical protein